MSKFYSLLLIGLVGISLLSAPAFSQNQNSVTDTEESFFEEDDGEPIPQIGGNLDAEEEPVENNAEPLPQIPRQRKAYDPRQSVGPQRIQHPLAEKGLIRITKDQTYIYKTEESPQNHGVSIRLGLFDPVNLENPENGTSFSDNYPEANAPMLMAEYEWQFLKTAIGKFGLKAGSGIYFANGNGRYKNTYPENQGREPKEVFTFIAFPNNIGAVYRLQFWDRQVLVPYVDGGLIGFTFTELRDDGANPRFGFSPAAYASAGLALNLGFFDRNSTLNLDREYGINSIYFTGEYRNIVGLGGKFDLSSDLINAGFLLEF